MISRESLHRLCGSCGAEIEEHAKRRYVAGFVLMVMWFVVPVIVVGYTRSSLVTLAILTAGAYSYLRFTKFVSVHKDKSASEYQ